MQNEFIRCAAVRVTQLCFSGANHAVCITAMKQDTEQGFLADGSLGGMRFVDRKEALEIATLAGQTITKHSPRDRLLSEDLKHDEKYQEFNQ